MGIGTAIALGLAAEGCSVAINYRRHESEAAGVVERTAFRAGCPVVVVTDPQALVSWDENAPNDPAIGKEKDRSIHVFTGKRHE